MPTIDSAAMLKKDIYVNPMLTHNDYNDAVYNRERFFTITATKKYEELIQRTKQALHWSDDKKLSLEEFEALVQEIEGKYSGDRGAAAVDGDVSKGTAVPRNNDGVECIDDNNGNNDNGNDNDNDDDGVESSERINHPQNDGAMTEESLCFDAAAAAGQEQLSGDQSPAEMKQLRHAEHQPTDVNDDDDHNSEFHTIEI